MASTISPFPDFYLVLAWILAILPSLWMPIKLRRGSQLGYWVLYLTVVIPSMFIPLFAGLNKPDEIVPLMLTMCAGTAVLGAGYLFPLHRFRAAKISPKAFSTGFAILAVLTTLAIVVSFWGNMHLVSFDEIYDLRDNAQDMGGSFLNYALMWSYGAVYPFLIGWGLYHRKWLLFLTGCLGQVLVYSCFGTKASLLSIIFIAGIYLLFRRGRGPFALKLVWGVAAILLVLVVVFLAEGEEPDLATQMLMFLVMFRSFGLSGLLTGQYYNFFRHNPHTLFSPPQGRQLAGPLSIPLPSWDGDWLLLLRGAGRHDGPLLGNGWNRRTWLAGNPGRLGSVCTIVLAHRLRRGPSRPPLRWPRHFLWHLQPSQSLAVHNLSVRGPGASNPDALCLAGDWPAASPRVLSRNYRAQWPRDGPSGKPRPVRDKSFFRSCRTYMRIVLISEVFARNMGYLENMLPKYLARLGAEVDVIASSLAPNYRQDPYQETYRNFQDAICPGSVETLAGFRLHAVGHKRTLGHVRLLRLEEKLRELRPHIVQTMTPIGWIAVDTALNRIRLGYRLFSGCHYHASVFPLAQKQVGPLDPERLRCLAERGAHGRAASWLTEKCYAISPDCAEVAARFFGVPRRKLEICPLGVDTEMFHPISGRDGAEERRELRRRLGFREEEVVCVYSGRFAPDKNPLLLARAVAELNRSGEPFRGLFVGHGAESEEIARCPGCVVHPFVPVQELAALYRASDIAVWPAQESMSMLDAAACGRPVIANDRMGAPERLTGCGIQYRRGDAGDLAEKIRSLRSAAVREGLGSRGAWRMQEEYSWEAIAVRRMADYSAVLAGRKSSEMHLPRVAAQESLAARQARQNGRQDGART